MKLTVLIGAVLFLASCSNTNSDNTVQPGTASHDQIASSYIHVADGLNVTEGRLSNQTPSFADTEEQEMAAALQPCTITPITNGATLGGAGCPVTGSETVTMGSPTSVNLYYNVIGPTFQSYNPIQTFSLTINATQGANDAINGTISGYVTLVNLGNILISGSMVRSATATNNTFTAQDSLTFKSANSTVVATFSATGHVTNGSDVNDTEACTLDGQTVNCATLGF